MCLNMKAQLELQFKMGSYRCLHSTKWVFWVTVQALYTQKPREGDRANKLKRESRHPILERKGYMPANGFVHAHMHMHAHTDTQLCCDVMGHNVSEPNPLQVAESQICMRVRKGKCDVSRIKAMCASKYSLSFKNFFSEHIEPQRTWSHRWSRTHPECVWDGQQEEARWIRGDERRDDYSSFSTVRMMNNKR